MSLLMLLRYWQLAKAEASCLGVIIDSRTSLCYGGGGVGVFGLEGVCDCQRGRLWVSCCKRQSAYRLRLELTLAWHPLEGSGCSPWLVIRSRATKIRGLTVPAPKGETGRLL